MRIVFYVFLSLLLFCALRPLYGRQANSYSGRTANGAAGKLQMKANITDPGDTFLDNADLDTEDDYSNDLDEDGGPVKFPALANLSANFSYLDFLIRRHLDLCDKPFKVLPKCSAGSSPIYIRQRVLRV